MNTAASTVILTKTKTPARLRTEKAAITLFDTALPMAAAKRISFVKLIRSSDRPKATASRLIKQETLRRAGGAASSEPKRIAIDFSDVREIEVKLIRRDRSLDPHQIGTIRKMNRRIATGSYPQAEFTRDTEALLLWTNTLPPPVRNDEREHSRAMRCKKGSPAI